MEATTNTFIRWFNADVIRPAIDGDYLCCYKDTRAIKELCYCAEIDLFNARVGSEDTAIKVQWWAFLPELPQKEEQEDE